VSVRTRYDSIRLTLAEFPLSSGTSSSKSGKMRRVIMKATAAHVQAELVNEETMTSAMCKMVETLMKKMGSSSIEHVVVLWNGRTLRDVGIIG